METNERFGTVLSLRGSPLVILSGSYLKLYHNGYALFDWKRFEKIIHLSILAQDLRGHMKAKLGLGLRMSRRVQIC